MRRRFQFSLGKLFWAMFIVAFFFGIWGFRSKLDFIWGPVKLIGKARRCLINDDLDGALAFTNRAVDCGPDNWKSYEARAEVLEARGDFSKSIRDYTKAISLGDDFHAIGARGRVYEKLGERDKAAADYCEAVLSDRTNLAFNISLIAFERARKPGEYSGLERYPDAVPSLLKFIEEAMERDRDNRDLWECRDLIARSGGDNEEATGEGK